MHPDEGIDACMEMRKKIEIIKPEVRKIHGIVKKEGFKFPGTLPRDGRDVFGNIELAYRHLEDARMRLGKCIQALDAVRLVDGGDDEIMCKLAEQE